MNSETVKPMPATAATPTTCTAPTPCGNRPRPVRTASHTAAPMPTILPNTSPRAIAHGSAVLAASPNKPPPKLTPAFASAKSGTTTNADQGCNLCSRVARTLRPPTSRSEEHTSELQSLMRISYAVFCLQKKNHKDHKHYT